MVTEKEIFFPRRNVVVLNSAGSLGIEKCQISDMVRQGKLGVFAFKVVNLVFALDVLLVLGEDTNARICDKDCTAWYNCLRDAGIFFWPLSHIRGEIQL